MGDLISEPIYGSDCSHLTPGVFPTGFNPENMVAMLDGIATCPLKSTDNPPQGSLKLTQGPSCEWTGSIMGFDVKWDQDAIRTRLIVTKGLESWFLETPAGFGEDSFVNANVNCAAPPQFGINGTAEVSLEAYEANSYDLAVTLNFVPAEETFYTEFLLDSPSPFTSVTRLSSHRWNTNCLIKRER